MGESQRLGSLALVSRPKLLSARDWADMWSGFEDRSLSYDDVVELIRANQDAARSVGRDRWTIEPTA
jgi:hypothetical protein